MLLTATAVGACGDEEPAATHAVKARAARPGQMTCAALTSRAAAHRLARKLVDRVVAPEGQSERETIGIIGESLYATCRQPRLPGVARMADYRPVKPVLAAIQRDFDEEEIAGH
ncbi:MAG TPA: hypothetical protein VF066_17230 [Thermoleophilaceae bacterium]